MSKASTTKEPTEKKRKPLNKVLIFFIFLEVAGFLTAIGFFIAAMIAGFDGFDLASIGGSIFFAVVGSSMALMIIGAVVSFTKQRKTMQTGHSSTSSAKDIPYTVDNYPEYATSSKKKVYYCSYCGYGTDTQIGECPECGGPIKEK